MLAVPFSLDAAPAEKGARIIVPGGGKATSVDVLRVQTFTSLVYPVTNSEFIDFLKGSAKWRRSRISAVFADRNYLAQFESDLKLKQGIRANAPVNNVSWFVARAYCESLEMRLPTIAEWEYMAAASEKLADASRDPEFLNQILEWYGVPQSKSGLSAVGERPANFYGVHDLHGLVWEWAEDFNSNLITGEGRADGPVNRNLFCGGGGLSGGNKEDYAAFMRFAFRSALKGSSTTWNLGFRCVKDVDH